MIAGTNTDCKILKTEIRDSTATITLLLFANKPTFPAEAFRIYIQDINDSYLKVNEETESYKLLSNEIYWIDNNTSFSNSLQNININKYKEIKIKIDITNDNTGTIIDNRWVRKCFIHFVNDELIDKKPAWSSDLLHLVSEEFEIPKVKTFNYYSEQIKNTEIEQYRIHLNVQLEYKSKKDFNYSNDNLYYIINLKSSNTILDSQSVKVSDLTNPVEFSFASLETYTSDVLLELEFKIKNLLNQTLYTYSKIFFPTKKYSNTYIKTKNGIKKVLGFYIKQNIEEINSKTEWLNIGESNE